MTPVDDELLSAYLDGELEAREAMVVDGLIQSEEAWGRRLAAFRADSEALRQLSPTPLSRETKDVVYKAVTENIAVGAERRRVPRYKRRYMMLAALVIPSVLTLFYLQNPRLHSRLYLRDEGLVLRSGRSQEKSSFTKTRTWRSGKLWGALEPGAVSSVAFQLDAEEALAQSVQARVFYDFNGDGKVDRTEHYEAVSLDNVEGWERFSPQLLQARGELARFAGGRVTFELESRDREDVPLTLSGNPGELVLPYHDLSEKAPQL